MNKMATIHGIPVKELLEMLRDRKTRNKALDILEAAIPTPITPITYKNDEAQPELKACMRLALAAVPIAFKLFLFRDAKHFTYIFDTLRGFYMRIPKKGCVGGEFFDFGEIYDWRDIYPNMIVHFLTNEGDIKYCKPNVHKLALCLDAIDRGVYKRTKQYGMTLDNCTNNDFCIHVNHANADTINPTNKSFPKFSIIDVFVIKERLNALVG